MLFNSHIFLLCFLPLTLLGYWALRRLESGVPAQAWLLAMSLVFYGWWKVSYLPLLLASITVNFCVSRWILRSRSPRALTAGILFNLGLLCYFKYSQFFLGTAAALLGRPHAVSELVLPLAVSFFTLQQVVFLVDTYEGLCGEVTPLQYYVYVTFFPHLIAGPIVLHNELIPQLEGSSARKFDSATGTRGLLLLSIGLLKKLGIADVLSTWAHSGFDGAGALGFLEAWGASLSYSLQLYFDFSGYSDMAIGIALLFHFQLPVNFRSPYLCCSIIDFWQAWHITLSRFITNYLYIPMLRQARKITFARSMLATLVAMLIAGLWHGADWRFVAFGAMHGIGLVVNHVWRRRKLPMPKAVGWMLTLFWVNLAFVFFRAPSWAAVARMLRGMFLADTMGSLSPAAMLCLALAMAIVVFAPNTESIQKRMLTVGARWAAVSGLAAAVSLALLEFQNANEFLYYKF